ncbi:hypothetical protein GCM10023205_52140 [Yinghuangia aomiensis]|uniref:Uncharacterized protein n=1 Tax=Yinghuangia aomiensis TaxID=676205 RepID=A0ABP9HTH1_9ACTN
MIGQQDVQRSGAGDLRTQSAEHRQDRGVAEDPAVGAEYLGDRRVGGVATVGREPIADVVHKLWIERGFRDGFGEDRTTDPRRRARPRRSAAERFGIRPGRRCRTRGRLTRRPVADGRGG